MNEAFDCLQPPVNSWNPLRLLTGSGSRTDHTSVEETDTIVLVFTLLLLESQLGFFLS